MVDFAKRLKTKKVVKKTDPIEIYDSLDRRSETGPLRPAQRKILSEWYSNRFNDKNLIVKLHTGQGKTLIGLLMLHSKLNTEHSPCLYICPNIYLVHQTVLEAEKFGIPHCIISKDNNDIPEDFINGSKILITHVQKVFNGMSIFGLDSNSIEVNNIILDDSHACIDAINSSFTIKINSDEDLYNEFLNLFEPDLINQGEGSFLDIKNSKYDTILPIPYWSWSSKKSEILKMLLKSIDNNLSIKFAWAFIKDKIENYKALVSGSCIEISPYYIPIHHFGTFNNANQRILMSATTQNDSYFIKGLRFNSDSIKSPLVDDSKKWSGEKMLILPSLIDSSLDREFIVSKLAIPFEKKFGLISLVPSGRISKQYEEKGSIIVDKNNIFSTLANLKKGDYNKTIVIVNRYDGIDLPDKNCRLLIIDSKPYSLSLAEKYEEGCRKTSDTINTKIAQKIEQGIGRSVRGEKDYCIIVLIGGDLTKFVKSSSTNKYFSQQTRKQIDIGLEIAEAAVEDIKDDTKPYRALRSLFNQSIARNSSWKEFYVERMDEMEAETKSYDLLELFDLEMKAEYHCYIGDYEKASVIMQQIIDTHCSDDYERGWYLQILARYEMKYSKHESNLKQKSAYRKNYQLMNPIDGITYKKLAFINEDRMSKINYFISNHKNFEELMLTIESIIDTLRFGIPAEKFESAIQELGLALGFLSQRPDKEFKKGPDNLWCGVDDKFLLIECKSEVLDSREDINKHEASQMNSHCGWFEKTYGNKLVKRLLIIPTKNLSYHADFTHEVEILRKNRLKKLRENVKSFFMEFKSYNISDLNNYKIQELVNTHELGIDDLFSKYSERYYHKK